MDQEKKKLIRDQNRLRAKKRRLIEKVREEAKIMYDYSDHSDNSNHDSNTETVEAINAESLSDIGVLRQNDENTWENLSIPENLVYEHEAEFQSNIAESTTYEYGNMISDDIDEDNLSSLEESSDSDSAEEESDLDDDTDEQKLRLWAIESKICQNQLDKLLDILRSRLMPNLPKSSKTFLGTCQARYEIEEMENSEGRKGSFAYFGIANGLQRCVNEKLHKNGIIGIQVHADEMPVSKSGTEHLWILIGKDFVDFRRFREKRFLRIEKVKLPPVVDITKVARNGRIKEIKFKQFLISTSSPNNLMILDDGRILEVKKFFGNNEITDVLQVKGKIWEKKNLYLPIPVIQQSCNLGS